MPESKYEPNVKDQSDDVSSSIEEQEALTDLRKKIEIDYTNTQRWRTKMITATNQRLGVKKATTIPYAGAPDIPMPETDKVIKKSTPDLVLSAWSPKKMCIIKVEEGADPNPIFIQRAQRAEMAMNNLLRSKRMNWFNKLNLLADNAKHYGHCIGRLFEDFSTQVKHKAIDLNEYPPETVEQLTEYTTDEKTQFVSELFTLDPEDKTDKKLIDNIIKQFNDGKQVIEFDMEEVASIPNVSVEIPTKVTVPEYTPSDINKANRIKLEVFFTRQEMEEFMDNGTFLKKDLDSIQREDSKNDDDDLNEEQKARNEGIDRTDHGDLWKVDVVNSWQRNDKDKLQKWVTMYLSDITAIEESVIYTKPFHFEFEGLDDSWDYEKYDNEVKDDRYYSSRGEPEMIRALQEVMDRSISNMLIRDEINNMPIWEVLNTSEIMDQHVTMRPGSKLPVSQIGQEIGQVNKGISVDISSERIMGLVKANVEEYRGINDQLFRNDTNAGGEKTLGGIKEGVRQSAPLHGIDVMRWNIFLGRIYTKLFLIFKERLTRPLTINGVTINKEDFDFPADVRSNGSLEIADNTLSVQKANNRLIAATQMTQQGVANQEDVYNAYQDWLEKDGVKEPDKFSTNPAEIMQTQLAQMQQQLQQMSQQAEQLQEANVASTKQLNRTKQADIKGKIKNIVEAEEGVKSIAEGRNKDANS